MARKPVSVLPVGGDVVVRADEVRAGMWLLDPETGEWGNVKQAGIGNACVGFGGVRTWRVSMRKLGAREFGSDEQVTVRMPRALTPHRDGFGSPLPVAYVSLEAAQQELEAAQRQSGFAGGVSPMEFTPDVLERALAVPSRAPHVFPEGPSARLVDPS